MSVGGLFIDGLFVVGSRRAFSCRRHRAQPTGNCGRPAGQYDVALVDWRRRTLHDLEETLDWVGKFLSPAAMLIVWVDAQKPASDQSFRASLEKRGYIIEQDTVHECGRALAARLQQPTPLKKAA